MRFSYVASIALFTIIMIFASYQIFAQECTELITQSFQNLAEVCADLDGASACTGSSGVESDAADFASAGDIIGLDGVNRLATTSESAEDYGVMLVNVAGNVPLALSETGIHYLLIGDTSIENQVNADEAFVPQDSVQVVAIVSANLRSAPTTDGRVVAGANPGTELTAYGLSADEQWLLVLFEGGRAWISRQVVSVQGEGSLDDFPIIRGSERSLMQSLNLTTSTETPDCIGTPPSLLLLQGPEGFDSIIEVNGVEIRFTSTIALRIIAENQLQLIVLEGGATSNNLSVPAGFTMFGALDDNGQVSTGWTGLRPITGAERVLLSPLESLSADNWYTAIEIPREEEVALTLSNLNTSSIGQTSSGPASGRADCSTLRPTSPLQTMGNRANQAFYWDGASGATGYRVNIYNESGGAAGTMSISSNTTTLVLDTTPGSLGGGSTFTWEVQALVDGQVACTTGRASVVRDAVPETVGDTNSGGSSPTATPCPWTSC